FNIFQDKSDNYWFAGAGPGVYRFDGKTITHFTTKDGLLGNPTGGFQEDKWGNLFCIATREVFTPPDPRPAHHSGLMRFDGKSFHTLTMPERISPDSAWKLQPDDLWWGGPQN